ncbi:MAG: hypothetical protein AB7F64_00935 [Gammaproteobacteria bacterium]
MIKHYFKLSINIIFLSILIIPVIFVIRSPKFFDFLSTARKTPALINYEKEVLRQATPFWTKAIRLYNTNLYRLHASNDKFITIIGKDHWLFVGDMADSNYSQAIRKKMLTEKEANEWVQVLQYETDYAKRRGIPFIYIPAPAKWEIYSDKMPSWSQPLLKKPSNFDLILQAAKNRNVTIIDARQALRSARKNADTYAYFNSHWTDYGAWVAWQQVGKKIIEMLPTAKLYAMGEGQPYSTPYDIQNEFGHIVEIRRPMPWSFVRLRKPLTNYVIIKPDGSRIAAKGTDQTILGDLPRITHNDRASSHLTVLIMRDSMGNSLSPFLQSSFHETYQMNHHHVPTPMSINIPGYIDQFKPDLIVYIMTERYFIYPLGDLDFWQTADNFDKASLATEELWTQKHHNPNLNISGDELLNSPLSIQLLHPKQVPHLVKITIKGFGEGKLTLHYELHGEEINKEQTFGNTLNELFFTLPANVDKNTFQLSRDTNQALLLLESITIRDQLKSRNHDKEPV